MTELKWKCFNRGKTITVDVEGTVACEERIWNKGGIASAE